MSQIWIFPENLDDSDEEQFNEDMKIMKIRYQGRWNINMMVDYC